jgi:hypothetical protein
MTRLALIKYLGSRLPKRPIPSATMMLTTNAMVAIK